MAMYDGPWMLDLFNRYTGRKANEAAIPNTVKYNYLSEGQNDVFRDVSSRCPWVLYQKVGYGSMPTMSTTDNQVFTFGLDANNNPVTPFGATQIYRNLSDIPDMPMIPDWDYLDEGTQIRMPRNRTYSGTLYWRGAVMPSPISDTVPPAFNPRPANDLVALKAAITFLESRNSVLADRRERAYMRSFAEWCLLWKRQFDRGGALTQWTMTDLAIPLR